MRQRLLDEDAGPERCTGGAGGGQPGLWQRRIPPSPPPRGRGAGEAKGSGALHLPATAAPATWQRALCWAFAPLAISQEWKLSACGIPAGIP